MTLLLLGEAALRALILAAVVGGGLAVLRVRNPHLQLTVWKAVLLGALVMPILMQSVVLTVPATPLPFVQTPGISETVAIAPVIAADVSPNMSAAFADEMEPFGTPDPRFAWPTLLIALYGAAAGALLLRLAIGAVLTWRLWRSARPLHTGWTAGRDVRISTALCAPVTVGSTILLPVDHDTWSLEKRRAVLIHERGHVERGDFYILLLAGLHRALFWFSPMAWWLNDKLAELAELASDAEAAEAVAQRTSYAAILLEFAATPRTAFMAVAMARPHTIRRRIEQILRDDALPARVTRRMQALVALAVLPLALLAAASLVQAPAHAAAPPVAIEDSNAPTPLVPPALPVPVSAAAAPLPEIALDPIPAPQLPTFGERMNKLAERNAERLQQRVERDIQRNAERTADRNSRLADDIQERVSAKISQLQDIPRPQRVSEQAAQETRAVSTFDSINFSASGTLRVTICATRSLTLEGDVETEVRDGTLVIRGKDGLFGGRRNSHVIANVTVPSLKDVKFSGSGRLYMVGLKGGETSVRFSGSGTIEATGALDKLALKISGSGNADIPDLVVADADIKVSGSGNVTIQAHRNLDVNINGSGNVRYVGSPANMDVSVSGSGSVRRRDET